MPTQRHRTDYEVLSKETLNAWRQIPPPIVGDCMNRTNVMVGVIKPVKAGTILVGQARTVKTMVGDNSALHIAIGLLNPGEVIVADGGGFLDAAIWGGMMTRAAMSRGIAGVIIDGAIRDVAEIRDFDFPCFTRSISAAGPHKGFGGTLDGIISCGGSAVSPGDIVIGDDDGVAIVPLARQAELYRASLEKIAQENQANVDTAMGILPGSKLGLDEPEWID